METFKTTQQVNNNTMEDYEYKVIKLHAIQSQNISKSTSDISKHTGKFTSETDRIRLGAMGGLPPLAKTSRNQGTGYTSRDQGTGYTARLMRPMRPTETSEG